MALTPSSTEEDETALRTGAEEVCAQLFSAVTGDFDFRIGMVTSDETVQKLVMLVNVVLDTARRAVEAAAERAAAERHAEELRDAHRIARIGTWKWDLVTGDLTISQELCDLLGIDRLESRPTPAELLARVHPNDRRATALKFARTAQRTRRTEHEWRMVCREGQIAWFWGETNCILEASGRPIAIRGVCQDVTEHRAATERIRHLAHHDPLTGLANRAALRERLDKAVADARCSESNLGILCLDLDGFKAVNDLQGHAVGDDLLRAIAKRLADNVRKTDMVARLGGDEFVVLQLDSGQPAAAQALAERIVGKIGEPFYIGNSRTRCVVTVSVGIGLFPRDGDDSETLLRNADTALYRAKRAGKNGYAFFRPDMDELVRERWALERDLREAASRGEFALAWQPIAAASDPLLVSGFEVLLRWNHPERGMVPPDQFIAAAEACGAITGIGRWVLREACREAASWTVPLNVAVNVSPIQAQMGDAFAAMVENALAETGLAPSRLILEVTEGLLIREPERALSALKRVKALGVRFALDDFGTGYSSLATLRAFPFDKVKIDRSFIKELGHETGQQDLAIVRAVLGLARGLALPVVAEGVETATQLEILRTSGCQEVQGWLIGRPQPVDALAHLTGSPEKPARRVSTLGPKHRPAQRRTCGGAGVPTPETPIAQAEA